MSRKHVVVQIGQYKVISRLLEGEFLDYKAAIPGGSNSTVTVDVRPLIDSIERSLSFDLRPAEESSAHPFRRKSNQNVLFHRNW